jgi:hypothetical protein
VRPRPGGARPTAWRRSLKASTPARAAPACRRNSRLASGFCFVHCDRLARPNCIGWPPPGLFRSPAPPAMESLPSAGEGENLRRSHARDRGHGSRCRRRLSRPRVLSEEPPSYRA